MSRRGRDAWRKAAALHLAVVLGFGLVSAGAYVRGYRSAPRAVVLPTEPAAPTSSAMTALQAKAAQDPEDADDDEDVDSGDCRRRPTWLLRTKASKRHRRVPHASELVGCWSSADDRGLSLLEPGESNRFDRELTPPSYTWGGPASGLQFDRDGHAMEFSNVMCSEESDPVFDHRESWTLADGELIIEGPRRRVRAAVELLDRRRLGLRVLEVCAYP